MQDKKEATRVDLETATRLLQPQISITMMWLKERGWAGERNGMMTGKGRPNKIYSLKLPFKDIIAQLEEQQRKVASKAQANIELLKAICT